MIKSSKEAPLDERSNNIIKPAIRMETPEDIGWDKQANSLGNDYKDSLKVLEPPPMILETLIPKRNINSGALKRLSI